MSEPWTLKYISHAQKVPTHVTLTCNYPGQQLHIRLILFWVVTCLYYVYAPDELLSGSVDRPRLHKYVDPALHSKKVGAKIIFLLDYDASKNVARLEVKISVREDEHSTIIIDVKPCRPSKSKLKTLMQRSQNTYPYELRPDSEGHYRGLKHFNLLLGLTLTTNCFVCDETGCGHVEARRERTEPMEKLTSQSFPMVPEFTEELGVDDPVEILDPMPQTPLSISKKVSPISESSLQQLTIMPKPWQLHYTSAVLDPIPTHITITCNYPGQTHGTRYFLACVVGKVNAKFLSNGDSMNLDWRAIFDEHIDRGLIGRNIGVDVLFLFTFDAAKQQASIDITMTVKEDASSAVTIDFKQVEPTELQRNLSAEKFPISLKLDMEGRIHATEAEYELIFGTTFEFCFICGGSEKAPRTCVHCLKRESKVKNETNEMRRAFLAWLSDLREAVDSAGPRPPHSSPEKSPSMSISPKPEPESSPLTRKQKKRLRQRQRKREKKAVQMEAPELDGHSGDPDDEQPISTHASESNAKPDEPPVSTHGSESNTTKFDKHPISEHGSETNATKPDEHTISTHGAESNATKPDEQPDQGSANGPSETDRPPQGVWNAEAFRNSQYFADNSGENLRPYRYDQVVYGNGADNNGNTTRVSGYDKAMAENWAIHEKWAPNPPPSRYYEAIYGVPHPEIPQGTSLSQHMRDL